MNLNMTGANLRHNQSLPFSRKGSTNSHPTWRKSATLTDHELRQAVAAMVD